MKIITLGASAVKLHASLREHEIWHLEDELELQEIINFAPDLIVSFGYRYLVREPVLKAFRNRIINLHISMLPWNRGADPNFWSWLEDTPKGVTIHLIDSGLDTGAILFQRGVDFDPSETLATSYSKLHQVVVQLFEYNLEKIVNFDFVPRAQDKTRGTLHRSADKDSVFKSLSQGWDTPCSVLVEMGPRASISDGFLN